VNTTIEQIWLDRTDMPQLLAIGTIVAQVWPRPGVTAADRAQQIGAFGRDFVGPQSLVPRSFVVRDGQVVVAHAAAVPRIVGTSRGDLPMVGLARVASHPDYRGQGLGQIVARAVFELVDRGDFAFCLFQTSHAVRPFYERLDCLLVDNPIVNSLAPDKTAKPFTDEIAMRYPAGGHWPLGTIDLRGPGF
jgi:GNAT superfamily N-acetyltransferase